MQNNYFAASPTSPHHLSVGAVVVNSKGKILCHHFSEIQGYKNIYVLMNETVELNETLEQAVHRGLMEEFGLTGEIITFLGPHVSQFSEDNYKKTKTTLYFLVEPIEYNHELRLKNDPESGSILEWQDKDFLLQHMPEQANRTKRKDLDQSIALEYAKAYFMVHRS